MTSANDLYWRKHCLYGLLEVDVTIARQFIEEHRAQTGEKLSFTGYLAFCLARAVDVDKTVQAYKKGRKQLAVFDNVDVMLMIEHKDGEKRALMGHIIQGATTRHTGRSTRRSAQYRPNRCLRAEACPPGSVPPCCFRGRCLRWSKLCSIWLCAVTRRFLRPWQARLVLAQ
jgi:chloramphenicol O-acetyltransferase